MNNKPLSPAQRLVRKNAFDASLVMGVEKFHRETGRDRHLSDAFESLTESLIDRETGRLRSELARDRDCPICGGRFVTPIFVKAGFPHGRCTDCGLIYVNPVLNDEAVLDHYREESSWVKVMESGPQVEFDRLKYIYGLDVAGPYLSGNKVLDVGAGAGAFVRTARELNLTIEALELHRDNASRLAMEGFQVYDRPLAEAGLVADRYDLVTLWEVIEHIVDPLDLLKDIGRILKPSGLLLVLVPNADSLVSRILHEKSGTFGGHSHVSFFNVRTLTRALNQATFNVLEAETLITELGTINNYLNYEDPYMGKAGTTLDFLTPELIHEKMLGSKLLVIARYDDKKEISS